MKSIPSAQATGAQLPAGTPILTKVCPGCQSSHSGPQCPSEGAPATPALPSDAAAPGHRIALSRIRVETSQYEFTHGHAPRGRGSWAFYFNLQEEPWWAPGSLLYSKARRLALAEAQRRGVYSVTVAT